MKCKDATASDTLRITGIVQSGTRKRSRAEILERSSRAATGFASMGTKPGDAIAILLRNDIPFLEVIFAANSIGAYWVPINWHSKSEEVRYILSDSHATHLVIHSDLLFDVRDAIPDRVVVICVPTPPEICVAYSISIDNSCPLSSCLDWDSWLEQYPALPERQRHTHGSMVYTSGTTGRPKGVKRDAVPPDRREAYAELRRQWFGHRAGTRTAIVGPMYHSVQASYAMAAFSSNRLERDIELI